MKAREAKLARDRANLLAALELIQQAYPSATRAVFETSDQATYGFNLRSVKLSDGTRLDADAYMIGTPWGDLQDPVGDLLCDIDWDGTMAEDEYGYAEVQV